MNIADTLRAHIEEFVLYGDPLESDDTSLIESGIIDSTGAMEMVLFIEESFGVEVPNKDIKPENLDTVNRMTSLVTRLSEATPATNVA